MNPDALYAWLFRAESLVLAGWVLALIASAAVLFRAKTSDAGNSPHRHRPR